MDRRPIVSRMTGAMLLLLTMAVVWFVFFD